MLGTEPDYVYWCCCYSILLVNGLFFILFCFELLYCSKVFALCFINTWVKMFILVNDKYYYC